MASTGCQHKLPDGTHFRLIDQMDPKPLDYVTTISSTFVDKTLNDSLEEIKNDQSEMSTCKDIPVSDNACQVTKSSFLYTMPTFIDWNAVVRDRHGPFWPQNYGPVCQTLNNLYPGINDNHDNQVNELTLATVDTEELNQLRKKQPQFKGRRVIFDSECSAYLSSTTNSPPSSPSVDALQISNDLTNTQQWTPPCLIFESRFESGNLRQVRRIGPFHYELLLKPDLYTKRHVQWFYFSVQNILPGFTYTFLIVNFTKPTSLYSQGLQPLLYSKINSQLNSKKWIHVGRNIRYARNLTNLSNHLLDPNCEYYQLEWEMEFPYANDICYLAYSYPYTYTNLKFDLNELLIKAKEDENLNKTMKCEVLCQTRAGNSCFLVTLTDQNISNKDKYAVVITARVHPGETNSSWITRGLLQFLTSNDSIAMTLKKQYIFYIIPMLNPDGVIVGNYRCSLTGRDLNRNYRQPRKDFFPTVWSVKQLVKWCKKTYKDVVYCDMHGHSRRNNIFMYGCDPLYRHSKIFNHNKQTLHERILPYILSQQATSYFSFPNCRFTVHPSKEATSRVVFWREFEVINSFTLEATFNGSTIQKDCLTKFEVDDFMKMGEMFAYSLSKFYDVISNPVKLKETVRNLAQQTLTNLWMNKIPLPTPENTITDRCKDNESIFQKISCDFLSSPDLKLNDIVKLHTCSIDTTTTTHEKLMLSLTSSNHFDNNSSLSKNLSTLHDNDDDKEQMNDSLEQLANVIHFLEKSIEFQNIKLNENEFVSNDEDLSCTSNSNSDSEPEMTITAQKSLSQQQLNLRGDLILTNEEQNILLEQQTKQLKLSTSNDDNINRTNKLKKKKKNKKKWKTLRHYYQHHHYHQHHHHYAVQKQTMENMSSYENQSNVKSNVNSKLLSTSTSASSSATAIKSLEQINYGKRRQLRHEINKMNSQTDDEAPNGRFYYLSKYYGEQSDRGIPRFVEKRLFHRSCQRISTVWANIDFTKSHTLHAQRKFVERFINNLETKIAKFRQFDNKLNTEILNYLKQIHLEANRQLQFINQIQSLSMDDQNQHHYKSTMNNTNGTIISPAPPPPLPVFTTGHQTRTMQSALIPSTVSETRKNLLVDLKRNNNYLNPRSKSCNLFVRSNNNNNAKRFELPKIVEKISKHIFEQFNGTS
ncbi:Cytosolic carboxypeptidase 2 [Schistosoma japonicum]|uniref:Cytosolic carboxypeptidase 2 n=1 Tax=Schistosoma japonicum TaxID=6182 RepID=A0A4Z2DIV7_SCHJA|nr:Cytosolic carboxypeptidase 2 [Schistosoma japonicum]